MSDLHTYSCQNISDEDIDAVVSVLRGSHLTQGPAVERFESEIKSFTGAKFAIAFNSATSALHASLACSGVQSKSSVWTTPNTFVATANSALYCRANVDFVDIDPSSFNLCLGALEEKLMIAAREKKLPDAIVPVHFAGNPVDMPRLRALSQEYDFAVIEDASHAFSSEQNGFRVGNCENSDACVFSFHPVKPITAGEGGVVTTNDEIMAVKLKLFRSHGITRDAENFSLDPDASEPWYYEQIELGYNYRLSDIHAALGYSQISSALAFRDKRNELAQIYRNSLAGSDIEWQEISPQTTSAFHLMVVKFPTNDLRNRTRIALANQNIGTNLHYIPVYKHPFYREATRRQAQEFPATEMYYKTALTLPLHSKLSTHEILIVCDVIKDTLS